MGSAHLVADAEVLDLIAFLNDLAHELVTTNEARRALEMTAVVV